MRGTYWLTMEPSDHHQELSELLLDKGFSIRFFKTLDALSSELKADRVSYIILGDEGPDSNILNAISTLQSAPEIQGAKLLLSNSKDAGFLIESAVYAGFRDVLPLDLPAKDWVDRFIFSTGIEMTPLAAPTKKIEIKTACEIQVPARISRISAKEILVESRVDPDEDDYLQMVGPLSQTMSAERIDLRVKDVVRQNLTYRFSRGVRCAYAPNPSNEKAINTTLREIQSLDVGPRIKVFLAIQSPALRTSLIRQLGQGKFEIRTALQRKSLIDEPQYFSPDILIIEERLATGANLERFTEMARILPQTTLLIIIGDPKIKPSIENMVNKRKIMIFKNIPVTIKEILVDDYEKNADYHEKSSHCFIPPEHEYSKVQLKFRGEVRSINPFGLHLLVEKNIGRFGLINCIIQMPNGKQSHKICKVINVAPNNESENLPYEVEVKFCNIDKLFTSDPNKYQELLTPPALPRDQSPKQIFIDPEQDSGEPEVDIDALSIHSDSENAKGQSIGLQILIYLLFFLVGCFTGIFASRLL